MPRVNVEIPAPDGTARGTLVLPEGDGPWPGVVLFPDAGGWREVMLEMAEKIAAPGYAVLVPDVFYRAGDWAPIDLSTAFSDEKERARLRKQALDWLRADLDAWKDELKQRPVTARRQVVQKMQHWRKDTDFAGVRGPEALAKLPEAERPAWQKLWADVAETLDKAKGITAPSK